MATRLLFVLVALFLTQRGVVADSGVSFEWVTVGDPGNPNDPLVNAPQGNIVPRPQRGSVPYVYSVSKYETTIGQYTAFLNAVAKSDPNGLFDPGSSREDSIRGIGRSGTAGNYVYYVMNVHWFSGGYLSTNLPVTGSTTVTRFVL